MIRTSTQWFALEQGLDGWKDGTVRTDMLISILDENLASEKVIERVPTYHTEDGDTFGRFIACVAFAMASIALAVAL